MSPRRAFIAGAVAAVALIALTDCAGTPVEAPLATACNGLTAGFNTAAAYRAQGKLTPQQIAIVQGAEAPAKQICDPTNPPADVTAALAQVATISAQLSLVNSGVK